MEKIIVKYMVEDMKSMLDECQFANQANQSINHYLIQLVDKVLKALDGSTKGEHTAVLCTLVDFSKAFDRQDPTLAIQSFQKNGVRSCLIPLLMSFFEDRKMFVKWHNLISGLKTLPGGGPQGCSLGLWSFLSQTNDNPEDTDSGNIFKFVDDKSVLEVINLLSIGIASHNPKVRVPSNVMTSNIIIPPNNLKTQNHLDRISDWTKEKKMKLNNKKTSNIIFNYSKNYQFSTDLKLEGEIIQTVSETKLLGTLITSDLNWNKNTKSIVKQSNRKMFFLHKASQFTSNLNDLKRIYMLQVRSKLEQSAVLWHFGLSQKNRNDLERVQKCALRVILGKRYTHYSDALKKLNIESLEDRRNSLCLKFAKNCLKVDKLRKMFPKSSTKHAMSKRKVEFYDVNRTLTERYLNSAIPQMQRMLNICQTKKFETLKQLAMPVNPDLF